VTELGQGSVIAGKYRLDYQVGRGGMGAVWAAHHLQLDTQVALKFIDPLAETGDARLRFEREAKAAAQLRSPHVVQILDHGVDGDRPYIAMELLEGEDLGERLRKEKRLSVQAAAHIFTQAAKALRRAHDAGVIHRDLKPSNIFLARFDDDEVVKLLDFGVAKIRDPGGDMGSAFTQTGVIFGSPAYMSPEQARGARVIDHRSDLWSLAVILFRAITGVKPFEASSIGDLVIKLCIDPIPVASHIAPDLSPDIDIFFERAFAREPEQRFPSAVVMAAAFEAIAYQSAAPLTPRPSLGAMPGSLMTSSASLPQYTLPEPQPPPRAQSFTASDTSRPQLAHGPTSPRPPSAPDWERAGPPSAPTTVMNGYLNVPRRTTSNPYGIGLEARPSEPSAANHLGSTTPFPAPGASSSGSLTMDPPPAPPSMTPSPSTSPLSPTLRTALASFLSLPHHKRMLLGASIGGSLILVLALVISATSRGPASEAPRIETQRLDSAAAAAPGPTPGPAPTAEATAQAELAPHVPEGALPPQPTASGAAAAQPPASSASATPLEGSAPSTPTPTGKGVGPRPKGPTGPSGKGGKGRVPNFGY
jgi:serine/threonine protein kinase